MFRQAILGVIILTVLALCVPASIRGAEKGDAVLEIIPADAIFCVRVNNVNQTTAVLDQYLAGIGPMPLATAGMIKGQLGMMFSNPELKGFNLDGSFAVFATAESSQAAPNIYILLPITDYNQVTDPNTRVSQPDANGVSTVGTGPAGQFFISRVRSFALMSNNYDKLKAMAGSVSDAKAATLAMSLDAAQAKQAAGEPIWCYANMVKISAVYGSEIAKGIEEIKKEAANPGASLQKRIDELEQRKNQIAAADPNSPMLMGINAQIEALKARKQQLQSQKTPEMTARVMEAYGVLVKDFMQQAKSVTLVCSPKPAVLNLKAGINALPGTEMAQILTADTAVVRKNELFGYAEDGAAMNIVGRINHTMFKKINSKFFDLFAQTGTKDVNSADIAKAKKLCDDMVDAFGDFAACSLSIDPNAKPLFDAKYVLEVKDTNQFDKVIGEFEKMWAGSAFNNLYKSMGMDCNYIVKHDVETYKGVSIDSALFSMKFTDANLPESQILNAMYGKGFDYRWAIVNGLLVGRMSKDVNAVYKLIDQAKSGSAPAVCSEMQKALSLIPDSEKCDFVVTYNFLRIMKFMSAFAPMPFSMPDIPTKSNLVFAAKADNGSVTLDIAAPKEHIIEISTAFQMMSQQMMQQRMQQGPAGMPRPVMPRDN